MRIMLWIEVVVFLIITVIMNCINQNIYTLTGIGLCVILAIGLGISYLFDKKEV